MTRNPLRPEEERSLSEPQPEVDVEPRPRSPHDIAEAQVTRWENGLARKEPRYGDPLGIVAHLDFTNDVRDRLRDDIAALLNDAISREHGEHEASR